LTAGRWLQVEQVSTCNGGFSLRVGAGAEAPVAG
jgi:hypothetical protein